jgi:nicotinamidase-related amidase
MTDGSVASTARDAGDRGYELVIAADASAALCSEDHDAALETLALWYGRVATTDAIASAMTRDEDLIPILAG